MTGINPDFLYENPANPRLAQRRLARTEATIVLLQTAVAAAYIAGAYTGLFDVSSPAREITSLWLWLYHVCVTVYSFQYRVRGRTVGWIEPLIPLLDISCVTSVYIALGDPVSPVWAAYLYALIGYSRRYGGIAFVAVSGYTITNLLIGWLAIGNPHPEQFFVMVVLALAVMALSYTISDSWREAEQRARFLAETDSLTALVNRRTFFERLEDSAQAPLSILMLDLDHFKQLNDEFGHIKGDEFLKAAARAIQLSIPASAIAGRFGGEEFIVGLPGVDAHQAAVIGESIRLAVAATTPTTVSVGCTAVRPLETIDQAIRRADELLYVAKRQGRDRVAGDTIERFAA